MLENKLLNGTFDDLLSMSQQVINDMYKKVYHEWEAKLKAYLLKNLEELGYVFETEPEFFEFCKNRIHRISFEEKPNEYEFYLDYIDIDNIGTFIGGCCDKIDFKMNDNTVTVTIGKSLKK